MERLNKTSIGYIIIGACLAVFCALFASAIVLSGESYDPETFCLDELSAHTAIVLDKTDPLNKGQQDFVLKYINKEKNRLKDFEKLSIFTLTEDTYIDPEPVFSKCSPGTGENANGLYQNPKKIRLKFEKFFSAPLKEMLENIFSDNTNNQSPIFEMIRELSYREDFGKNVPERTLIIISDMMHHTSSYSHYREKTAYEDFSETSYGYEVVADLDSLTVKIIYLLRPGLTNVQGKRHLLFWEKYFQAMGAEIVEVRKIR